MIACQDYQGRTCLELDREKGRVRFSPFDPAGLRLEVTGESDFDKRFKPIPNYPVKKAAQKYLDFAMAYGSAKSVLIAIGKVIKVPKEMLSKIQEEEKTKRGNNGPSAAQMFKDLILENKLSDDDIFKMVKKEFGLDDKKRSYVQWYKNDLKKKGLLT